MNQSIWIEDFCFVTIATTFFFSISWLWRFTQPFKIPQPLPSWFRGWLAIVLIAGIVLPIAALGYWGFGWAIEQLLLYSFPIWHCWDCKS